MNKFASRGERCRTNSQQRSLKNESNSQNSLLRTFLNRGMKTVSFEQVFIVCGLEKIRNINQDGHDLKCCWKDTWPMGKESVQSRIVLHSTTLRAIVIYSAPRIAHGTAMAPSITLGTASKRRLLTQVARNNTPPHELIDSQGSHLRKIRPGLHKSLI